MPRPRHSDRPPAQPFPTGRERLPGLGGDGADAVPPGGNLLLPPLPAASLAELGEARAEAARLRGLLAEANRRQTLEGLSAGLAHDLAQPLGAIILNAETLQRRLAGRPGRRSEAEAVADILLASRHAEALLERLRGLMAPQPGRRQPLRLDQRIRELLPLLSAGRHGCEIRLELAPLRLWADPLQLDQLLLNLAGNGLDAIAAAGRRRGLLLIRLRQAGDAAVLTVSDNGTGAEDSVLARLFDPLFSTKPRGLGLGLAICRQIVTDHGGTLRALRNRHHGLTLEARLPIQRLPRERASLERTRDTHRR